jgi:hypothetical protein
LSIVQDKGARESRALDFAYLKKGTAPPSWRLGGYLILFKNEKVAGY